MSTATDLVEKYQLSDRFTMVLWDGLEEMTDLNAAYYCEGQPAPEDDDGWARIAYRLGRAPSAFAVIRRSMAANGDNAPWPDWFLDDFRYRLERHRERRDRRATLLRFLGVLPAVTAKGVRT